MRQRIVHMEFNKTGEDVRIQVGQDDLRKEISTKEVQLSSFIELLKNSIPERWKDIKFKIDVYIGEDREGPVIDTVIKYPFWLARKLGKVTEPCATDMNKLFQVCVLTVIQNMQANSAGNV